MVSLGGKFVSSAGCTTLHPIDNISVGNGLKIEFGRRFHVRSIAKCPAEG